MKNIKNFNKTTLTLLGLILLLFSLPVCAQGQDNSDPQSPSVSQRVSEKQEVETGKTGLKLPFSGGWDAIFGLMSFGGIAGFCVGFATKKIAKLAAFAFGVLIISIQLLASKQLLTVNWTGIEQMTAPYLSGGGLSGMLNIFIGLITVNLPFAGPFIIAFWFGLKSG